MTVRDAFLALLLLTPAATAYGAEGEGLATRGAQINGHAYDLCLLRTASGPQQADCNAPTLLNREPETGRPDPDHVARQQSDAPCPTVKPEEAGIAPPPRGCRAAP